jgi:hypothetical protein
VRRQKITGLLCDEHHPFPAPKPPADFLDSMEDGAETRRTLEHGIRDVDPTPIYRMAAAHI